MTAVKTQKLSPRSEALAYRIWGYCEPRGWNVLASEIAEALDEGVQRVSRILQAKDWQQRLRSTPPHPGAEYRGSADFHTNVADVAASLGAGEGRL